jgi:hypothetical protein
MIAPNGMKIGKTHGKIWSGFHAAIARIVAATRTAGTTTCSTLFIALSPSPGFLCINASIQ